MVAVVCAAEGVLPVVAHGAVDALEYGLALVVGQAAVPRVAEGFADDVGAEVADLLRALPVVGGPMRRVSRFGSTGLTVKQPWR